MILDINDIASERLSVEAPDLKDVSELVGNVHTHIIGRESKACSLAIDEGVLADILDDGEVLASRITSMNTTVGSVLYIHEGLLSQDTRARTSLISTDDTYLTEIQKIPWIGTNDAGQLIWLGGELKIYRENGLLVAGRYEKMIPHTPITR